MSGSVNHLVVEWNDVPNYHKYKGTTYKEIFIILSPILVLPFFQISLNLEVEAFKLLTHQTPHFPPRISASPAD